MRTLTPEEKRTIRFAGVGIAIYLVLFGGYEIGLELLLLNGLLTFAGLWAISRPKTP